MGTVALLVIDVQVVAAEDAGANHEQRAHGFAEAVGGERVGGGEVLVERFDVLDLDVGDGEAGEVLPEDVVEEFALLFGVVGGVDVTATSSERSPKRFSVTVPLSEPSGWSCEAGGAADGVEVGDEDGKLDDLAVGAFDRAGRSRPGDCARAGRRRVFSQVGSKMR